MGEKISHMNIADASIDYMTLFGMNKNVLRVTPSFFDGMKPGKRRMFWAWWQNSGKIESTKPSQLKKLRFSKVDIISANTMKYHPHSDDATKKLIGREGQYWNNNVMTIVPKGAFGNVLGVAPAAGRYIEAKMSEYTIDCFFNDFSKYSVPMNVSYDGSSFEPEYLPAKYPHILFNPQFSGIGYGSSSNIPPFNVTEVLRACIKLLKNPNSNIRLIPDIPTGCDIVDIGEFDNINETGVGKILMRCSYEIDYTRNCIKITSLPITITTKDVVAKIITLVKAGKLDGIMKFQDFTQNGEVNLEILLKKDASPNKVMKELLKKTDLQFTLPVSFTVEDDYNLYEYGIKEYLLKWLEFRKNMLVARYNKELQTCEDRKHILTALIDITDGNRGEDVVKIIRKSKNNEEAIKKLMDFSRVKLSSVQARNILSMSLSRFTKDAHQEYVDELDELENVTIKNIMKYLSSTKELQNLMISQFEEGIAKYGHPRKSKVISDDKDIDVTKHLVGVSENGYIKKVNADVGRIGVIGKTFEPMTVLECQSSDTIAIFTDMGEVQELVVKDIPDMDIDSIGTEHEKLTSGLHGRPITIVKNLPISNSTAEVISVTSYGMAKRSLIKELGELSKARTFMGLNSGDRVTTVLITLNSNSNKDYLIYTNDGNGVRIPLKDVKTLGRTAKGTKQISLRMDEVVTGASIIEKGDKFLFYITTTGKGKITYTKDFPTMKRGAESANMIKLDSKETLVACNSVQPEMKVMVFKRNGEPVIIDISDLSPSSKVARGEKLVKTPKADYVIGIKIFK